jgi:phage baseplate assembly protein W
MKQEFYSLPLALDKVMLKYEHSKCSLQKSVAQHLHLLLTTAYGELQDNETFGCSIWDHDFDNVTSGHKLKEFIHASVLSSIAAHEKRLGNVRVQLVIQQEERSEVRSALRIKKRIDISITGILQMTNENFSYQDSFFIGPLSY